jgi:type I restriction enzyme R subunit
LGGRTKATYKSSHSRDKLESYIGDYNTCMERVLRPRIVNRFKIFQSIRRLKEREKENNKERPIRYCHRCNMMLTGFDAKKVNTLYVDKNLATRLNTGVFKDESNIGRAEVTREHFIL